MKHVSLLAIGLLVTPTLAQENPDDGGPDYWQVHSIGKDDALNIRAKPSSKSEIVGRVGNGAFLKNGGCAFYNGARWCEVEVHKSDLKGWAYGKFLREGYPPGYSD